MKKTLLSLGVATFLLTTNLQANECPTTCDRVAFGTIGVIQGFVIGGPIGAFWGLGAIIFADNYEGICDNKPTQTAAVQTKETPIEKIEETKSVQEKPVNVDEKLDSITQNNATALINTGLVVFPSIVQFDYDSYKVNAIPSKLDELKDEKIEFIKIDGHTDSKGSDEYNFALGLKRANAVKDILIKKGISSEKLSVVSYGESNPISNNDFENRRVDLNIKYSVFRVISSR